MACDYRAQRTLGGVVTIVTWLLVAARVVVAPALRAWYLFDHPITSDEAIGGLMAQQALHGHSTAFDWGQSYGGVELDGIALQTRSSVHRVHVGPVATVLAIPPGLAMWRIARRGSRPDGARPRWLALLRSPGRHPCRPTSSSTYERGSACAALSCGLSPVLLSLRVADGHQRARDFVALGLVAGVGWWSSPEIVYFVPPAAVLLVERFRADPATARGARWGAPSPHRGGRRLYWGPARLWPTFGRASPR